MDPVIGAATRFLEQSVEFSNSVSTREQSLAEIRDLFDTYALSSAGTHGSLQLVGAAAERVFDACNVRLFDFELQSFLSNLSIPGGGIGQVRVEGNGYGAYVTPVGDGELIRHDTRIPIAENMFAYKQAFRMEPDGQDSHHVDLMFAATLRWAKTERRLSGVLGSGIRLIEQETSKDFIRRVPVAARQSVLARLRTEIIRHLEDMEIVVPELDTSDLSVDPRFYGERIRNNVALYSSTLSGRKAPDAYRGSIPGGFDTRVRVRKNIILSKIARRARRFGGRVTASSFRRGRFSVVIDVNRHEERTVFGPWDVDIYIHVHLVYQFYIGDQSSFFVELAGYISDGSYLSIRVEDAPIGKADDILREVERQVLREVESNRYLNEYISIASLEASRSWARLDSFGLNINFIRSEVSR